MSTREQYLLEILTTMLASSARMQNIRALATSADRHWIDELARQSLLITDSALSLLETKK